MTPVRTSIKRLSQLSLIMSDVNDDSRITYFADRVNADQATGKAD